MRRRWSGEEASHKMMEICMRGNDDRHRVGNSCEERRDASLVYFWVGRRRGISYIASCYIFMSCSAYNEAEMKQRVNSYGADARKGVEIGVKQVE